MPTFQVPPKPWDRHCALGLAFPVSSPVKMVTDHWGPLHKRVSWMRLDLEIPPHVEVRDIDPGKDIYWGPEKIQEENDSCLQV